MSSRASGAGVIECDAPPYYIVRACRELGFQSPEDVRWLHVDLPDPPTRENAAFFGLSFWKSLIPRPESPRTTCVCGYHAPELEQCIFTLKSGGEERLFLGQCVRCRTIHWRKA